MSSKVEEADVKAVSRFITAGYFYDVITKMNESGESENYKSKLGFLNFSEREKDLLKLIADGMSNEEIATKLYMSKDVVNNKIEELFAKLENKEKSRMAVFSMNKND